MQENAKNTIIAKYGSIENYNKIKEEKRKQSRLEKYGNKTGKEIYEAGIIRKYGSLENFYKIQDEKKKKTRLEKYGNKTDKEIYEEGVIKKYGSLENFYNIRRESSKKTNLEKYGTERPMQNEQIKEKARQTNLKKYGGNSPMCYDEIQEKSQNTCFKNYRVNNPSLCKEIQEKREQTFINNYGVNNPSLCKEIQEKREQTFINNYGVDNPFKNEKIKKKSIESFKLHVKNNENGKYNTINTLRSDEFWKDLESKQYSLNQLSKKYNLNSTTLSTILCRDEFRENYKKLYHYPKLQTQREIYDILLSFGIKNISFNNREAIKPLEIDIYLPDYRIGIEYNGNYWHSTALLEEEDAKLKHIAKYQICKEKGINIINIFETNWLNRKEQVIYILKDKLNIITDKINTEHCQSTTLKNDDFFEKYHIDSYDKESTLYFNLTYNNETIFAISFKELNNDLIITRISIKCGVLLFDNNFKIKQLLNTYFSNYNEIIGISENSSLDEDIFKIIDFRMMEEKEEQIFYWDIINNCYIKNILNIVINDNYCQMWNCGEKTWKLKIEQT